MVFVVILLLVLVAPRAQAAPSKVQARIIGGADATVGTWPSFAGLTIYKPSTGLTYLCGGTLITPTIVLTAAHCAADAQAARSNVFIGDGSTLGSPPAIKWSAYKIHPDYNPDTVEYDVALITLASASTATPMPLVSPDQDVQLKASVLLDVAGFGRTSDSEPDSISDTLKEVAVPFVSDDACQSAYARAGFRNYSTTTMICAGEVGKDSCNGDSGGPLTLMIADTRTLVGDVSWGPRFGL